MFDRLTNSTRPHYEAVAYFAVRDLPFRMATGLLLCLICINGGYHTLAFFFGIGVFGTNIALRSLFVGSLSKIGLTKDQTMHTALCITTISIAFYGLPGVYLSGEPSVAIKLISLLWIMGVQIYVSNRMSHVTVFLNFMLAAWTVFMLASAFRLFTTPPSPATTSELWIAALVVIIFCITVFWVLREHTLTEAHLQKVRQETNSRLVALEQSQKVDDLTGVLNRPAFDMALSDLLEQRSPDMGEVAVFLVDLDSFKPINDTYSHDAGDTVLRQTAKRLRLQIGSGGIVGRLGGDEFICALGQMPNSADASVLAQDIAHTIAEPIDWNGRKLRIGASIGFALTGQTDNTEAETVSGLCSAADQAMFAAKSSPNADPVFYQAERFAPRMSAADMRLLADGLADGAIRPHYQPKFNLKTGQIVGVEALARWHHPTLGLRMPAEFIGQIDEMGLQGDFMISQAKRVVADVKTMLAAGLDPGQVSVNLSEVALATYSGRTDLHRIVATNPDAARHLTFEITEDVFIARAAETIQTSIASFRALGVRISLDDFGTGFASFHHLRQLDFDELKIDTTFVEGLGRDATSEVLVNGFLNIASGLGVSVVAEGVETDAQSRDLQNMGCIVGQGHLFSAAVPLEDVMSQLSQQQAA